MSSLSLYNQEGKKVKEIPVPEKLLAGPIRKGLLFYMVRFQLAKRRAGTHSTKTRSMAHGSTRKIYRQKGTGQARHGDRKAPIFVGGGKVFTPHPRDYGYNMPRSAKRQGLRTALALKGKEGKFLVVETPHWKAPKTQQAISFFKSLKSESGLLVLEEANAIIQKSVSNLKKFRVLTAAGLNVYDILNFDHLLVTEGALKKVLGRLGLAS